MLRDGSVEVHAQWCGNEISDDAERCERVHRTLKRIVKARGALDAQEAAALREAQAVKLWRAYGYASLLEYMEREMGYSPRAALERLRVAKAIEELPLIGEAMNQGELSYSAARELTRVATAETEKAWIDTTADKNLRQLEAQVSGHKPGDKPTDAPDPSLRRKVLRHEVKPETYALWRQMQKIIENDLGRLDHDGLMSAVARFVIDRWAARTAATAEGQRAIARSSETGGVEPQRSTQNGGVEGSTQNKGVERPTQNNVERSTQNDGVERQRSTQSDSVERSTEDTFDLRGVRTKAPYQVAVTLCTDCRRGWQDGDGIVVEMSPPAIERALCDAEEIGSLDATQPARATQAVPPAVRRLVSRRDHGKCRVPDCRSSRNLDIHHLVPREQGGTHAIDNLLTLCEAHHLAHHEGSLLIAGALPNLTFTRSPNHAFKLATRIVDTTKALRGLGFKMHEAKAAVEATRTHVGDEALTLEQWIKLALSKCPKPSS